MDEIILLNRIRVDIGNVSGPLSELLQYAGMAGFNDNYEPQAKPRLVGTWTINDWYTTAQLAQAQSAFDGLTIVENPNYVIDFDKMAIQSLDNTKPNYNQAVSAFLAKNNIGTYIIPNVGYFINKDDALNVTSIPNQIGTRLVEDTLNVAGGGTYDMSDLSWWQYFGITSLGMDIYKNRGNSGICVIPNTVGTIANPFKEGTSLTYVRLLRDTPATPSSYFHQAFGNYFSSSSYKLYVGDGSSAAHDDAILQAYLANSNWNTYFSTRLDTWYNYLHPQS